ncbi:alpha-1,2-mannosyltransferase MNN21 [Colletotrichum spaethianum]|uniref:Alpha-1,2-mannosyltransferase MNN21 n=1 Tax=Colletotrichum spaethianum TaxID=700344 RepID=A0AA37L6Q2_9PEZI|nr:alpha-1,2-mannosyltransferase MNN21 [Colletotrichum spaethianum]GKT40420.1 alpha-1,2-mannosyltransferase MNN21 [Colletotrichum spaethianum]
MSLAAVLFPAKRRRPLWLYLVPPILSLLLLAHIHSFHFPSTLLPYNTNSLAYYHNDHHPSAAAHLKSKPVQHFWKSLQTALHAAEPSLPSPLRATLGPPLSEDELDSSPSSTTITNSTPRRNLIALDDASLESLTAQHASFVSAIKSTLSKKLPVWKGTRGVVMTAGSGYLGTALTSILMLRRSGSRLPVHLFLDTRAERAAASDFCDGILPRMAVECLVMEDLLLASKTKATIKHFQYKVLSILLSPFQQTLYLDSDAWPVHDPEPLFASEPFTSHGLVTWPDFWLETASPNYYRIANATLPPPRPLTRRSSESGILLYDKATHADDLLLAAYYNWFGPDCFYPLLSQGAPGEGDKETFLHAAQALARPFWDVRTPVTVLGRWINGTFETATMRQADPAEDFRLFRAAAARDHAREDPDESKRRAAKTFFIHHNLFKLDVAAVGAASDPMFRLDEEGRAGRLWGPGGGGPLIEDSGFDVERRMWDVVLAARDCGSASQVSDDRCGRLVRWYEAVFGEAPPLGPASTVWT